MREITLANNRGVALVDDDDYSLLCSMRWHIWSQPSTNRTQYARSKVDRKSVFMHRFIMRPTESQEVDHINGNGLDNRRINLRLCRHGENQANRRPSRTSTSKYLGVHWDKRRKCWRARLTKNARCHSVGSFETEREAAVAYDVAAKLMHGEFARTNESLGLL